MILLVYPKYVGGKFISNCLSLSRHCVVQHKDLALADLAFKDHDDSYYNFKLKAVMRSIPPSQLIKRWAQFEFGCKELYGVDEVFYQDSSVKEIKEYIANSEIFKKLDNHQSCVITHDYQTFLKYLYIHNDAKIVDFVNFDRFRRLAATLKDPRPEHVGDEDYLTGENYYAKMRDFYQFESFSVDVDDTFFSWDKFNPMMESMYQHMGFDDYQPDLVKQFYEAYIALHQ
jgi:hypothetical protein